MMSLQKTQRANAWREEEESGEWDWDEQEELGAAQAGFGNQLSCQPRCFMMMPCNVISVYILIDPFSKRSAGIAASSVFLANECEGKGNAGREPPVPVQQELGLGMGAVGLKFVLSPTPLA